MLAMAQLGVYEEHPVVVRTAGCNESIGGAEPPTPSAARLCRKFVEGFVRPLQGRSSLATDASRHAAPLPPMTTLGSLRRVHRDMGRSHVCFRRVLAGGYHEMFNTPSHAGKEPWLALYRHRVLAYHGIVPAHAAPCRTCRQRLASIVSEQPEQLASSDAPGPCRSVPRSSVPFGASW